MKVSPVSINEVRSRLQNDDATSVGKKNMANQSNQNDLVFKVTSSGFNGCLPENIAANNEGNGAFLRVVIVVVNLCPPIFNETFSFWFTTCIQQKV